VVGIITDGDLRKFISRNRRLPATIAEVMNREFLKIDFHVDRLQMALQICALASASGKHNLKLIRDIVIAHPSGIYSVSSLKSFDNEISLLSDEYVIFGMGYVGLTLAAILNHKNYNVIGIESDATRLRLLRSDNYYVHEPDLSYYLTSPRKPQFKKSISEIQASQRNHRRTYVITVNTPLDENYNPDESDLQNVIASIALDLQCDDLVLFRSTLSVGSTRRLVTLLESATELRCGVNFFAGFVPERTVEGNAIKELETLPQVVSGLTLACLPRIMADVQKWAPNVYSASGTEVAELVKLANNAFRDYQFAFANELSMIANDFDVDIHEVIELANRGYPRSHIAKPSPGVGGPCLSKDSHILLHSLSCDSEIFPLENSSIIAARQINDSMPKYAINKMLKDLVTLEVNEPAVQVVGIAFKGLPETNDGRNSPAAVMFSLLKERGIAVSAWDAVMNKSEIEFILGPESSNLLEMNVILIGNNNPKNLDYILKVISDRKVRMIFDPWNLIQFADKSSLFEEHQIPVSGLTQKVRFSSN
jgi:nucleotide sugar dehydrogenase